MPRKTAIGKQTANKRSDGKFAPGNKIGNRFKKGESGNPEGRPKRTRLTDALLSQLAEISADEETKAELIARALINQALAGNVQAIREIGDRTEGKPKQSIDIEAHLDWRELAHAHGLNLNDVLTEARLLIEQSASDSSDAASD